MFALICVWINGWENNREAGDLRRYRTHSNVTIMRAQIVVDQEVLHGALQYIDGDV